MNQKETRIIYMSPTPKGKFTTPGPKCPSCSETTRDNGIMFICIGCGYNQIKR